VLRQKIGGIMNLPMSKVYLSEGVIRIMGLLNPRRILCYPVEGEEKTYVVLPYENASREPLNKSDLATNLAMLMYGTEGTDRNTELESVFERPQYIAAEPCLN
jgi:hypothetical protein